MKKKIEGELISIAHRLLKLKNHTEITQLHEEVKKLYEQLTLLKFYEENTALVNEEFSEEAFHEKVEKVVVGTIAFDEDEEEIIELTSKEHIAQIEEELFENNEISHEAFPGNEIEKKVELASKEHIAEIEEELFEKNKISHKVFPAKEVVEEVKTKEDKKAEKTTEASEIIGTKASKQITMEDVLVHDYQDTLFVKKEDIIPVPIIEDVKPVVEEVAEPVVEEIKEEVIAEPVAEESKMEEVVAEMIEEAKKEAVIGKAIVLGLNDKVAFERNLFANNGDDLNRVISQLNTFTNWDEAKSFVLDFVKPDYNNWEGKEEFETRFLEIVENKFK